MYDFYSVVDFDVIPPNTARTVLQEKPRARSGAEKMAVQSLPAGLVGGKGGDQTMENTDKVGFE